MSATPRTARRQRGFSLTELMVAMTISLGFVAALVTLVVNNSRAHTDFDRASRQIENGRYAMEYLSSEIRLAGYFGELQRSNIAYVTANPCATDVADPTAFGFSTAPLTAPVPLQAVAGTVADPAPTCLPNHLANTPVLILRRVETTPTLPAAVTTNNLYLQTSRCIDDSPATPFVMDDVATAFTLRSFDCAGANATRRYVPRMYFLASCSDCGNDSIPTLKRADLADGNLIVTALAEGIEELRFEFGFDTDGNGTPEEYRTALNPDAAQPTGTWSNVMTVRMWMISRTTEATRGYRDEKSYDLGTFGTRGPYNDEFKRRAYSQVVRLTNPAGYRE